MEPRSKLPATIDRVALYEDVWVTPMSRLESKYGISGPAIRKLCDKLQVPVPPRGHWMRLESGYPAVRPPLPDMVERESHQKKAGRPRNLPSRVADREQSAEQFTGEPSSIFVMPSEPTRWHPALSKVRAEMDEEAKNATRLKARYDWEEAHPGKQYPSREQMWGSWRYFCDAGQLLGQRHRKSPVRLSFQHYRRGLIILNMLCELAVKEGYVVRAKDDGSRIQFATAQAYIDVRISEKLDVDFRSETNSWDKSIRKVRRLQPTGRFAIYFEQQGLGHTEVVDKPGEPLEGRMVELASALTRRYECSVATVARWAEERRKREEEQLRRQEEERKRKELEQLAADERRRREALLAKAENWEKAELVRRYIASVDANVAELSPTAALATYADWRSWAIQVAEDLDASQSRAQEFLGSLPP